MGPTSRTQERISSYSIERRDRPKAAFRMARECGSAAIAILYLAGAPVSYTLTIEGGGEVLPYRVNVLFYTYRLKSFRLNGVF